MSDLACAAGWEPVGITFAENRLEYATIVTFKRVKKGLLKFIVQNKTSGAYSRFEGNQRSWDNKKGCRKFDTREEAQSALATIVKEKNDDHLEAYESDYRIVPYRCRP